MSVIGFDIGNESCVIAAAKRGGVDVLLNDESKRETPAVVSFGDKQRFLGAAGAAFAMSNPKSTISQIKRLIGKVYKEVVEELKLLPFVTSEGPRGGILIELEYLKTKRCFTPVEILGMLFKHLKQIIEKNLESSVVDCVIGIPSYFTDLQRRLYLDAAQIAGLNPLRLMHDGTAIALGYGMYKTDLSNSGPTYVMFVDIGHCDTQVTVAAFEQGKMNILAHSFDQNLGGRDFDDVIFNHFASQFNEKHKIDIYSNARASARLRASCEKVKKVLSDNAEAPLSIECLIRDTDVRGLITREEFESLSSKLLERVIVPCRMALKDSGLRVDVLYTIELVGSGSCLPAITSILTAFFSKEPTRTLNASECVARGCALRCAMLSPVFKVRDYKITESFPYSIVIPSPQGEVMVFPKGSPFPNQMMITYTGNASRRLQLVYIKERDFPAGISHIAGCFEISPSEPFDAEKVKIEFKVKLNGHGIVKIDSATILEDKRHNSLKTKLLANSNTLNLLTSENLDVSTTNDELHEAIEKETVLTEQDVKVEEIKDQRNTLESFVYDIRSKLSGAYRSFATDSEKEVLISNLQETEDWLYEDSDDESEQDYIGKLKDLQKLLEPLENRYIEENAIAKATKSLKTCIAKHCSHADSLPADKKDDVKSLCTEAEQWLIGLFQKQLSPKTLLAEINRVTEVFEREFKSTIRSKSSASRHEEPVDSDQRDQTVDSENAMAKTTNPLQACLAHYYLVSESLPADKKEKILEDNRHSVYSYLRKMMMANSHTLNLPVSENLDVSTTNDELVKAEEKEKMLTAQDIKVEETKDQRNTLESFVYDTRSKLSGVYQSFATDLEEVITNNLQETEDWLYEDSDDESEQDYSGRLEELKKLLEPIENKYNEANAIEKATKSLQSFIAKWHSHADSLPADMKEKVKNVCAETEQWRVNALSQKHPSPKTLFTDLNHAIEFLERDCERIVRSKSSYSRHKEPVGSDQRNQTIESDPKAQSVDMVNAGIKALQACIEKYYSHAESLPADKKEKVNHVCTEAHQWLMGALSHKESSPNTLANYINHVVEEVERKCKSIISSKPSFQKETNP